MKTGLILKIDDLINWCNTVFSARMRFSATTANRISIPSRAGIAPNLLRLPLVHLHLALLICAACYAQGSQRELRFADLGQCVLDSGAAISPCKIGYRTFGDLNTNRSNAVLVPMWFTGKTADLELIVGPGKLLDPRKYFII